jgi:lysine 2,3-aminomutase
MDTSRDTSCESPAASEPPSKGWCQVPVSRPQIIGLKREPGTQFPVTPATDAFRRRFFPEASQAQWNDWRWQLKNRLTKSRQLGAILELTDSEREALEFCEGRLPMAVTPYYASLLNPRDPNQPLRRTVIPTVSEFVHSPGEADDPLAEDHDSPVPGLVHRYPDRVLLLATDFCSTYCRYCTRSRRVGKRDSATPHPRGWDQAIDYIANNPVVRDVLVSGGDPLTMPDMAIEYLLSRLRKIPHVEILRIGTKVPMVLPQRVTASLTRMLSRYHPLFISIHCTHPAELTPEAAAACRRLADAGIPLGSQTVLMQGINDSVPVMTKLFQGLLKNRVKPYYLYQCDQVYGSAHFRTPLAKGIEIMRGLRGHTSGYAIPHFVIDLPEGGGKTPVCPNYLSGVEGEDLVFTNYEGLEHRTRDESAQAIARELRPDLAGLRG